MSRSAVIHYIYYSFFYFYLETFLLTVTVRVRSQKKQNHGMLSGLSYGSRCDMSASKSHFIYHTGKQWGRQFLVFNFQKAVRFSRVSQRIQVKAGRVKKQVIA